MAELDPAQILAWTDWEAAMEHVERCRVSTPVRAMAAIPKVKAGDQDLDR